MSCTDEPGPRESEETLFQLVLPAAQREVALKGCHDEVGHLGLEGMVDLMSMTGSIGLTWLLRQKSTLESAAHALPLQLNSPKPLPKPYHGHTSLGACPPQLPVSGTWKRPRGKCSG